VELHSAMFVKTSFLGMKISKWTTKLNGNSFYWRWTNEMSQQKLIDVILSQVISNFNSLKFKLIIFTFVTALEKILKYLPQYINIFTRCSQCKSFNILPFEKINAASSKLKKHYAN
jgi:hypothetical protein